MNTQLELLRRLPVKGYETDIWGHQEYTGWMDEQMSWKTSCCLGDWSWLTEVLIKGPDAKKFLSGITVNNMENLAIGQAKHAIQCNQDGKIVVEGILMRLGEEEFVYIATAIIYWDIYQLKKGHYHATAEVIDWTNFQVSGPKALYLVEKIAGESLRDVEFMHFKKIKVAGVEVYALRQGMAGEIGFEILAPLEHYQKVYDAIWAAGQEYGLRRLGGRTAMINHLEACFPSITIDYLPAVFGDDTKEFRDEVLAFSGQELASFSEIVTNAGSRGTSYTLGLNLKKLLNIYRVGGSYDPAEISGYYRSPVDFGWARNIKFDHEFIGRQALEKEVAEAKKKIVTLVWNSDDIADVNNSLYKKGEMYDYMEMPRNNKWITWVDKVMKDGKIIGVTTNRGYSVYFREMLSHCPIDVEYSNPGTEVTIIWGNPGKPQKEIRAKVAKSPYKQDNRRADLKALPASLK